MTGLAKRLGCTWRKTHPPELELTSGLHSVLWAGALVGWPGKVPYAHDNTANPSHSSMFLIKIKKTIIIKTEAKTTNSFPAG
jgi:hypothetical protein